MCSETPRAVHASRDQLIGIAVTSMAALIVCLAFAFGFDNVWTLALRLGVPSWIAPLVAPAVDLSVLALLVALRHLAIRGASSQDLTPARWLLVASCLTTLALNVAEPLINGEYGRAAFDCVGPLLLIGWSHVGPELLSAIYSTQHGRQTHPAVVEKDPACSTAGTLIAVEHGDPEQAAGLAVRDSLPSGGDQLPVQLLAAARKVNTEHWLERGRPASAETLRQHLHVGSATARRLKAALRTHLPSVRHDLAPLGPPPRPA